MNQIRSRLHARCFVCDGEHPTGLRLEFREVGDGLVEGDFDCDLAWEGLEGRLHGGVVAALLDGAMSNCLLARGVEAVTADLQIRYLHPVEVAVPARVHARVRGKRGPIYDMEAWLVQDEQIRARARARFVDHQGVSWP